MNSLLCKVIETFPGPDDCARTAAIKTSTVLFTDPFSYLHLFLGIFLTMKNEIIQCTSNNAARFATKARPLHPLSITG